MKIAHLTTVDMSLRYLLLPQLDAALAHGEVIGISAPGPHVAELESRGIRHVPLEASTRGINLTADIRSAWQLWIALRRERPDILHTHNPKPGVYGRVLGRLAGVPIVVNTVHGLYATPESKLWKRAIVYGLEMIASRFSDAELVQNPEDLELMMQRHIAPRRKLRLLGNGVDLSRFNPERSLSSREDKRKELGVGVDEVVVGFVGRLVAEKGLPELVQAASMSPPSVRFVVVGPGDPDKADSLDSATIRQGEEAGVLFLGMRHDVEDLYGAFDIFALPSHREGYPRAAMEAAASGLPVIATDIRGCREVVADGVNGVLVPVNDPERLSNAIEFLAGDLGLREQMGLASADRARALFDEDRVVEIVMQTYRNVAARKGIDWRLMTTDVDTTIRKASQADTPAIAMLHVRGIDTGFLSSLGPGFLRVLYEGLIASDRGTLFVAEQAGTVIGFVAGVSHTGKFYKEFLRRRAPAAVWRMLPALLRPKTWKRAWDNVRYGTGEETVSAELLAMAVAPLARRRGLGASLVQALLDDARSQGIEAMKVVVGADNPEAISLYESTGFGDPRRIEIHAGTPSLELLWSS